MARLEGLTASQADELANEWRQLGATDIRRTAQDGGLFTMECNFPVAAATSSPAESAAAEPAVNPPSKAAAAGRRAVGTRPPKPR